MTLLKPKQNGFVDINYCNLQNSYKSILALFSRPHLGPHGSILELESPKDVGVNTNSHDPHAELFLLLGNV